MIAMYPNKHINSWPVRGSLTRQTLLVPITRITAFPLVHHHQVLEGGHLLLKCGRHSGKEGTALGGLRGEGTDILGSMAGTMREVTHAKLSLSFVCACVCDTSGVLRAIGGVFALCCAMKRINELVSGEPRTPMVDLRRTR